MKRIPKPVVVYVPVGALTVIDGDSFHFEALATEQQTLHKTGLYFKDKVIRLPRINSAEMKDPNRAMRVKAMEHRELLKEVLESGMVAGSWFHTRIRILAKGAAADKYGQRIGAEVEIVLNEEDPPMNVSDYLLSKGVPRYGTVPKRNPK